MGKRKPETGTSISEQQTLGWLWRGLKLTGRPPRALAEMQESHYDQLDEVRPLPISWKLVYITCAAFPVCRDIWLNNAQSMLHDLLSQSLAGVLLVSDSTVVASYECLHLVYSETCDIDPFQFDADTPPNLVHPGWGVACEKLGRK